MDQKMILISKDECERLIRSMQRSIHYCTNARSSFDPEVDLMSEPTDTYPGASGYACSTMKDVVCSLESHILYS